MNFKKIRFAAIFAGIILSGSLLVSSAESDFPDLEIISIDEVPSPQTNSQTEAQTRPQTEAQTEAQTKPQTEAKVKPQTEAQTKPQTEAQTKPQTEAQTKPQTEAQTKPQTEAKVKPQTEAQTKPQTEAQTKPQTEAKVKPQTEAQTKPQTKPQTEAKVKPQTETEAKTKPQSETQTEIKTTPGTVLVVDGRPESEKSETETAVKSETKAEPESETEAEPETKTKPGTETEPETKTKPETETESESETEPETETESETESETEAEKIPAQMTPGVYEIASAQDPDLVLDVCYCTVQQTDSHMLQLYHSLDVNQQRFYLEALPHDRYRLSVLHTGEAMTASGNDAAVSMAAMNRSDGNPAAAQSWTLEKADGDACYIRSESGKYLTLDDADAWAGVPVVLSEFSGEYNQMWEFLPSWISADDTADTDPANPYVKSGRCSGLALTLQFGTETETLTAADLAEHMVASDGHELVIEPGFLDEYVAELAEKYNTPGRPVLFRTTAGDEITLYEIDHGWTLDTAKTKALIEEHLGYGQAETLMPVWEPNENEEEYGKISVGDSYVEVDLKHQKVYLYKDGQMLLETDCVSGTYHTEAETPEGVYYIYFMQSPDVLNGPGYSDFVNFWAAFYRGYGLHDATWRDEFGGDIYLTDGSHGCVNLPLEAAGQIYNTLEMGYPVVLYK